MMEEREISVLNGVSLKNQRVILMGNRNLYFLEMIESVLCVIFWEDK